MCLKAPETVKGVPSTNVWAALLLKVKLLSVCEPDVKNRGFVMPVPDIIKLEAAEPVKLPLASDAGKV